MSDGKGKAKVRASGEIARGLAAAGGLIFLAALLVVFTPHSKPTPPPTPNPTATPRPSPPPPPIRIGIVSGHKDYDGGAMCPDGILEVDINYQIAT